MAPAVYNAVSDGMDFIGCVEDSLFRVEEDFKDALKNGFMSGLRYGDLVGDAIPPRVRQFCGCREQPFDVSFCEAFFAVHVEALIFNRGTAGVDGEYYRHGRFLRLMLVNLPQAVVNDAFSVCGVFCWKLRADAGE